MFPPPEPVPPSRCPSVSRSTKNLHDYAAIAGRLENDCWGEELIAQVRSHFRTWVPDWEAKQFLWKQPPEIARLVLANWDPSDPNGAWHTDFSAYYVSLINRMKRNIVEGTHQAALVVFHERAQASWGSPAQWSGAGSWGGGAPPGRPIQADTPPESGAVSRRPTEPERPTTPAGALTQEEVGLGTKALPHDLQLGATVAYRSPTWNCSIKGPDTGPPGGE